MALKINYKNIRITLGVFSAIAGLIFLSKSSFFDTQFGDTKRSEIFVFAILSALLVLLVFASPSWNDILQKVRDLKFSVKATVDSLFLGIVWLLAFLIKYPRFDVHSRYIKSCTSDDQGKKVSYGSEYTLYSFGAFALLSLLLSLERQKSMELGFFGILIGLIMDTSMEIPRSDDEPNLWYIFGSILYCIGLIFFKRFMQSLRDNGKDYLVLTHRLKQHKGESFRDMFRNSLVYFSATVGLVCLFLSPFSEQQFEGSPNLKGICFIAFSLMFGSFLPQAPKFIDTMVTKCEGRFSVKAIVKSFLFMIVSGLIFVTKYPRFKIQSHYRESSKGGREKKVYQGHQFDVYSTGSFSLFALTMSSEREQPVKLGIFSFLLELTMDTSIEILGNDQPNFLYMLGAALYCALLILVKSYLDSSTTNGDPSGGQHVQPENAVVSNVRDKSSSDEQPLISIKTVEVKGPYETGGDELNIGNINITTASEGEDCDIIGEETEIGDEQSIGVVYGLSSQIENETHLLNRRERQIAKRREKTRRGKERKREKLIQKEDLWIF